MQPLHCLRPILSLKTLRPYFCTQDFDSALTRVLTDPATLPEERRAALVRWATLPEARFAQPREEHLLPLHVVRARLLHAERGPMLRWTVVCNVSCAGRSCP